LPVQAGLGLYRVAGAGWVRFIPCCRCRLG